MTDEQSREWLKLVENVRPFLPTNIRLYELLSVGGQGVVYRGLVDDVDAAIKIYLPGQVDKRIEREIRALTELECKSIVELLWAERVSVQDYELYVVATVFVEGTPLDKLILLGHPLGGDQLGIIAYDVALAVEAMWERRIVHRDLKPSNILVRPDGRACVIDLGFARHLNDSSLTKLEGSWGTYGYLSPEQRRGSHQLTCKSDIFALGVVLIEAAMGRHPTFKNQQQLEVRGFHQELPRELTDWKHADLLKRMLDPMHVRRPMPHEVLQTLSSYAN